MNTQACINKGLTQFQLSKITLRNLNKFNLKPTAKLVLLSLVDHYPKIYPSQQTIANELGISLRAVKSAIKELSSSGLVIYETNYFNTYKLTSAFFGITECKKEIPDSAEYAPKEIKKEIKKQGIYKNNVFAMQGQSYPSAEQVKANLSEVLKRDDKSPMNDKKTALKFISELEGKMSNPIIKVQVDRIKRKWNL